MARIRQMDDSLASMEVWGNERNFGGGDGSHSKEVGRGRRRMHGHAKARIGDVSAIHRVAAAAAAGALPCRPSSAVSSLVLLSLWRVRLSMNSRTAIPVKTTMGLQQRGLVDSRPHADSTAAASVWVRMVGVR
jgi:hypothetical protein